MAHRLQATARPGTVAAVDIGGTLLKGAVVTADGTAVASQRVRTAAHDGAERVAEQVERLISSLSARAVEHTGAAPLAVGLVAPGAIDADAGVATFAANIHWSGLDLRARVRSVLDVPVVLGHDATAGAIGEATYGAARDAADFLFVALGTGIGASVFLQGQPYRGAHGLGGEIGHVPVRPDGPRCGCGEVGCLETLASAAAVRRRYGELGGALGVDVQASDVLRRAAGGTDPAAVATRDEAVDALATVLTGVQRLLDLELVVLGGGMAAAGEVLVGPLAAELARRAAFGHPPRLTLGALGSDAGSYGAAVLAWEALTDVAALDLPRTVLGSSPAD